MGGIQISDYWEKQEKKYRIRKWIKKKRTGKVSKQSKRKEKKTKRSKAIESDKEIEKL